MKFAFIQEHPGEFEVERACEALGVSRSGYYAWLKRPQSGTAKRREELAIKVKAVHEANRGVYGSPRV
ncbi:MAG: insF1, partial [Phycisphaerales bacterium]|nr:insF1 [Phycisphaerales bacterium]